MKKYILRKWKLSSKLGTYHLRLNLDLDDFEAVYTLNNAEFYFAFNINTDQNVIDSLQSILDGYRATQWISHYQRKKHAL